MVGRLKIDFPGCFSLLHKQAIIIRKIVKDEKLIQYQDILLVVNKKTVKTPMSFSGILFIDYYLNT
jgi:hypothetical protein